MSERIDQQLVLDALIMELGECQPKPGLIHHTDQGRQYSSTAYVEMLKARKVKISMANVGEPEKNGYAEILTITIKEEKVDLSGYEDSAMP